MSSENYSDKSETPPKKKCYNKQKAFKNYWLDHPKLKSWLLPGENPKEARCKICNITIVAGKSELIRHSETTKHCKKANSIKNSTDIRHVLQNNENDSHMRSVKKAEIKLVAFFASNNVAIHIIDQLEPLLKEIFSDSKICQGLSVKRTKCTEIMKNVICKRETQNLVSHLQHNNFSILVDESTDLSDTKSLAILVRYIDNCKVETRLLQLIELDARQLGANELYNVINTCFKNFDIPLINISGFASDGASVMVGKKHSVFYLLKQQVPHLVLQRCICHSAALVASKACAMLPQSLEKVIREIYNYISGSPKRLAQFKEMQDYFNSQQLKILQLANTRWLSRYECICRLLKNWTALEHYFIIAVNEDHPVNAKFILNQLQNRVTKAYMTFLKYVLNYFNAFNALFQSRKPLIHILYTECMSLMKQLCKNYIDHAIVLENDLATLDLAYPRNFLPREKLYVGPECELLISNMPTEEKKTFLRDCQNFYIAAAVDLQKRLPDKIFQEMNFLDPSKVFSKDEDERNVDFSKLCDQFQTVSVIDKTDIIIEWRRLPETFTSSKVEELKKLPIDQMWLEIVNTVTYEEQLAFPNLKKLVCLLLIQPHSNSEAERIFSIVTDTKTKKRNRLGETCLNAICVFRSYLQCKNQNAVSYNVGEDHLKLFKTEMYSFKSK